MYVAEISLAVESDYPVEKAVEMLVWLTNTFRMNGQMQGRENPIAEQDGFYRTFLMTPARDSLDARYANKWVNHVLERFHTEGLPAPVLSVLGKDPGSMEECGCAERSSFILYTDYLCLESSLRCGDCFGPVPLYSIPATYDEEFYDLICWQSDYQACDQLQMNCRTGEQFGLRELSRHDSNLSRQGREVCKKIEAGTELPVFYYLHRYRGRSRQVELARRCPECGGEWPLETRLHDLFDFQCHPCRLLSNIAFHVPERQV